MNKYFVDKKALLISAALLGALSLAGCGNTSDAEKELAVFSSSIADFADYIQEADERINSLDVNRKESASELLEILDSMETEFAEFAALSETQAPDQYESIPSLAKHASEEMSLAVSCYHTAYESEEFEQNYAEAAYKHYTNSMKGIKYIGFLLMGEEIPEDDNVTVYEITNDEHILDKWLSGDKEDEPDNDTTENGAASE